MKRYEIWEKQYNWIYYIFCFNLSPKVVIVWRNENGITTNKLQVLKLVMSCDIHLNIEIWIYWFHLMNTKNGWQNFRSVKKISDSDPKTKHFILYLKGLAVMKACNQFFSAALNIINNLKKFWIFKKTQDVGISKIYLLWFRRSYKLQTSSSVFFTING